ncbi:MAG: AMP-binding protein [Rhodospirillales bacterium]|nr:AMP-binding protein [Rhodospirillales bacterium]
MQPPDAKTIPDLLDELAARYPDHEALVGGETRLTYRELREEVRRLAKGLHALGVRRGDKVGLLMGNRPEWILADFAIALLGGTMVAINTWATARELVHVLKYSDTKFLITVDRFL